MCANHVSTEGVGPQEAFAFWNDVICETFIHLDCTSPDRNRFTGRVSNVSFADLQLSSMASDQIDLRRSKSRIATAREEYGLLVVQGRGRTLGEQDGRRVVLDTGDVALFDSVRPYYAQLQTGFHHFILKIPREKLRQQLGPLEAVTATKISGKNGIGRVVAAFIRSLPEGLDTIDVATAEQLANSCVDLVAAALGTAVCNAAMSGTTTKIIHLTRAKSFIAANIHRSDLSPEVVAGTLGVTTRYLGALFTADGISVSRYIWRLRLDRCKASLADPRQAHRSISEIAFAWGFNNMSHFSHMFRQQVGTSPREFRAVNRATNIGP